MSAREENFLDYFDKNFEHDFDMTRHKNVSSEYSDKLTSVSCGPFGLSTKTVSNIRRPEGNQDTSSQATRSAGAGSRYKVFKG